MSKSRKDPATPSADSSTDKVSTPTAKKATSPTQKATSSAKKPTKSTSRADAADELARRTTAKKVRVTGGDNPRWWVPTMVTLMVVGLLWLVVTYLGEGKYPAPSVGVVWNLGIGFALVMAGFLMTTRWK